MPGMRHNFCYSIHGIVAVRSERRLPELEYFRGPGLEAEADIEVRVARAPAKAAGPEALVYREALGRWGFEMAIVRGEHRTQVDVSPLVAASPHVLYTNVVEPLLRWTFVRKGYALMHGACLARGDAAVLVTARTDTGKTTTILKTLRSSDGSLGFLSDDMTILGPDGQVYAYPKPLTISRHTVHAIGGAPLGIVDRWKLVPQSRLHSKGGRGIGMRLYQMGMPAATLSAIVQRLIPPPKFMVHRLVEGAPYALRSRLERIVVIERGAEGLESIASGPLVDLLVANAEDAYGFPPYPRIEHALCRWHGEDLHEAERAIVEASVTGLEATLVRSSTFGWHEHLLGAWNEHDVRTRTGHGAALAAKDAFVPANDEGGLGVFDGR